MKPDPITLRRVPRLPATAQRQLPQAFPSRHLRDDQGNLVTAGFRLCGADSKAIRIECRIGGADLNPYLAFPALIAAGLAGVEQKLELYVGDAYQGKALREVPKTLREGRRS
jgi:Glutamine synthetase, catalytic domain